MDDYSLGYKHGVRGEEYREGYRWDYHKGYLDGEGDQEFLLENLVEGLRVFVDYDYACEKDHRVSYGHRNGWDKSGWDGYGTIVRLSEVTPHNNMFGDRWQAIIHFEIDPKHSMTTEGGFGISCLRPGSWMVWDLDTF